MERKEIYSDCLGLMDLTTLNSTDTTTKVEFMIEKVNEFQSHFSEYPSVAAVCVYPNWPER